MIGHKEMILVIIALIFCFVVAIFKPVLPADLPSGNVTYLGEFEDGKVRAYRIDDPGNTPQCYALVGELHGKTVAIDCVGGTYHLTGFEHILELLEEHYESRAYISGN